MYIRMLVILHDLAPCSYSTDLLAKLHLKSKHMGASRKRHLYKKKTSKMYIEMLMAEQKQRGNCVRESVKQSDFCELSNMS